MAPHSLMSNTFYPSDDGHPARFVVEPPEAYLILADVDYLRGSNDNQMCKLAFLIQLFAEEVTAEQRRRYKIERSEPNPEEEPVEGVEYAQFWIGAVVSYAGLRREIGRINDLVATQQRALLTYTCRIVGLDVRKVESVLVWELAGRG